MWIESGLISQHLLLEESMINSCSFNHVSFREKIVYLDTSGRTQYLNSIVICMHKNQIHTLPKVQNKSYDEENRTKDISANILAMRL